jgi:hypothetical protein
MKYYKKNKRFSTEPAEQKNESEKTNDCSDGEEGCWSSSWMAR